MFAGLSLNIYAAAMPVTVSVVSYQNGELIVKWNQPAGTQLAVITYHVPDGADNAVGAEAIYVRGESVSPPIKGLKADYIYDINVTLYGEVDSDNKPVGEPTGRGLLFFLTSITFTASTPDQVFYDIPGGGREIGARPKLKLNWRIPKAYYSDPVLGDVFAEASATDVKDFMENSLNDIYIDNPRDLNTLNFRINISSRMNLLNSGSSQAAILIDQDTDGTYEAYVSGTTNPRAVVTGPDVQGFQSIVLEGRADTSSEMPVDDLTDSILPDSEILPGTVYYMNIKPIYKDVNNNIGLVSVVTVGSPENQNGSLLSGERSYINTPIRFQLTKDSANNIYVKIYKVNQGSLDLPRLYYEVQVTDDPSLHGDWEVKKSMDDSYFSGDYAITVLSGINPNNTVYYKIVVKSENSTDRLESLAMPYTLTVDTSRPPLPMNIAVINRELNIGTVNSPSAEDITVKSSDITLSWEKPSNWDSIKNDLYFHFLISTNQSELPSKAPIYVNGKLWGADEGYDVKYRMVKYISAISPDITDVGNRLEYTISAFDLFTWDDVDDSTFTESSGPIDRAVGDETYPSFLVPNTVYYMQMYTTIADSASQAGAAGSDAMSDRSIITSFTTLNGVELDVPLPMSFELEENSKITIENREVNSISLRFDKVSNLDWKNYTTDYNELEYKYDIYYDIYMNTRTNTEFIPIGTTQDLNGDVGFSGADDVQSTSVISRISQFTQENTDRLISCGLLQEDETRTPRTVFGPELLPNTTYYYLVRTRLVVSRRSDGDQVETKTSMNTAILPVTTVLLVITPPDDSKRKPLAPTDFTIAVDSNGNRRISGSSVTFTWPGQEDDVLYQLIRTTSKVNPTAELAEYENDPEYTSLLAEFGRHAADAPDRKVIYLDPADESNSYEGRFTYIDGVCTFTVDRAMFPNKLYYFSLKTIRVDNNRNLLEPSSESVWVSIPVTTALIDPPSSLEVIQIPELGFWWNDETVGLTGDDFRIYIKTSSDAVYKLMTRAQSSVIKDPDGRTYYGRVTGLKPGTAYDVKVSKGNDTVVLEKAGLMTRDSFHQLEIKWIGKPLDNYGRYEIAIMEEGSAEYTILNAGDLEHYADKNGSILPYYTDEAARTLKTDELHYYARIRTMNVALPGGVVIKQPLRSNVRYLIKVRAVKVDPVETDLLSYSKYIGPVSFRTEFNQEDYDNRDREEQQRAVFLDRMKDLDKGYFWKVAMGKGTTTILLKGDRVEDALRNSSDDTFVVDISSLSVNISRDEVYIPLNVVNTMKSVKKSLAIRTNGTQLVLRPGTLDSSFSELTKDIYERNEVKDIYVKLNLGRGGDVYPSLPSNQIPVSEVNRMEVQAQGFSVAYSDMDGMFYEKLYDEDAGLVSKMLSMLQNAYVGGGTGSSELIDQYTRNLVEMIEKELSAYVDSTLKSSRLTFAVRDVSSFDAPLAVNLTVSGTAKGVRVPYVLYDSSASWQKITSGVVESGSFARFTVIGPGSYVILAPKNPTGDVKGHWAENSIMSLVSQYDLEDVFPGVQTSFMPNNKVTCTEVILLYEKVIGKSSENTGLDARNRLTRLKLDGIIPPNSLVRNADRQQTAAVLSRLFCVKKGIDAASLKPAGRVVISDESNISDEYYASVIMVVDINVMRLDGNGKFNPRGTVSRAELAEAFVRLLRLTEDI
jgi:hypothetical protein